MLSQENTAQNIYLTPKDSNSFFINFVHGQNKTLFSPKDSLHASLYLLISDDATINTKTSAKKTYYKSLFTSHQLQTHNERPINLIDNHTDWISGILIFCFVLFVSIKFLFNKKLILIIKACFTNRFVSQLIREGNIFKQKVSVYLFINYFLLIPLFIYQVSLFLLNLSCKECYGYIFYGKILLFMLIYFFLKNIFLRFIGNTFKTRSETSEYVFHSSLFNLNIGIFLLPLMLLTTYAVEIRIVVLYMGLFLIGFMYLYKLTRIIGVGISSSNFSVFHLFLYLCTVEILPLLILIKLIINFIGIN